MASTETDTNSSGASAFLSTHELAAKYPVEDTTNSERAWYRLILRLRDKQMLREGVHWKYRRDGERTDTRVYLETHVLKLLWNSDRPFAEKVRIQHRAVIVALVRSVMDVTNTALVSNDRSGGPATTPTGGAASVIV